MPPSGVDKLQDQKEDTRCDHPQNDTVGREHYLDLFMKKKADDTGRDKGDDEFFPDLKTL